MSTRFLSQARLDRSKPVAALARVLNPLDEDAAIDVHHRLLWTLFADKPDRERGFLWRADDGQFLILSTQLPEDRHSLFELQTKRFEPSLARGDRLAFRLRVNAVVTRSDIVDGKKRRRRHDVVMDRMKHQADAQLENESKGEWRDRCAREAAGGWLEKQGTKHGFDLLNLHQSTYRTVRFPRPKHRAGASLGVLDIDGVLRAREPGSLLSAVNSGFGKAKGFGCGLMLLRRA